MEMAVSLCSIASWHLVNEKRKYSGIIDFVGKLEHRFLPSYALQFLTNDVHVLSYGSWRGRFLEAERILISYLVAAAGLQIIWSLSLAMVDIYAILVKRSFRNHRAVSLFAAGDGITSTLIFAAACASAGITVLIGNDLDSCSKNHCLQFETSTGMAFLAWRRTTKKSWCTETTINASATHHPTYRHCGKTGHDKQRCFEIIGYPASWVSARRRTYPRKRKRNSRRSRKC
ncbi:hypothetical protein Cgig2_012299 [Carnegiea gigantea]|uniref:CASP-like protein n=1 Tax=Carnegiea gigantea TaxID=171969 RepID=A0A9Q1K2N1_9CARY|nr:hypothetical protein Cgig2_012299 [Carnegiea gigantea]